MSRQKFRTAEERRLVSEAISRGWVIDGRNGMDHIRLRWPPTGALTVVPSDFDTFRRRMLLRHLARIERGEDVPTPTRASRRAAHA